MSRWVLALHGGSHNSNIALARDDEILEVLELERFVRVKDASYEFIKKPGMSLQRNYIFNKYGITKVDCLMLTEFESPFGRSADARSKLQRFWGADQLIMCKHHASHAANGFYQSPYQEAVIVSADGMGNDGCFNIYHAIRGKELVRIGSIPFSMGSTYSRLLYIFGNDVKIKGSYVGQNAGKLMGMTGLGKPVPELFDRAYHCMRVMAQRNGDGDPLNITHEKITDNRLMSNFLKFYLRAPVDAAGNMYTEDRFDYVLAWQKAWEKLWLEKTAPFINDPAVAHLPIVITGGTALNILANTLFENVLQRPIFVPVNPDDRGLGAGMLLNYIKPKEPADITYLGASVLGDMPAGGKQLDIKELAARIVNGEIYGIMRGRSEVGARALGNRSIVCHAVYPNMKDIINAKIKKREWYRPFAPMVRLEDVGKYFTRAVESRWMNFASMVCDEYKDKLPAITHTDGTARVQTVTKDQNPFMYDLLTEIDRLSGVGVILNTSFNVRGQPIITYTDQAWTVFTHTQMDGLVIEDQMWTNDEKPV